MQNFEILEFLAEGQYGIVYKALYNNEIVAVKKLKEECSYEQGMQLREIAALKRLNHPNIVQMKGAFEHERHFYIVFEYCERNLLSVRSVERIRGIMFQLLDALHYMHSQNLFHRDLKPENILLFENQVKICDFGLARDIRSNPPYTEYVATRWYRAPEILLSKPYNYQVDIFALGLIMAELYLRRPLVAASSQIEQLQKLEKITQHLEIPNASAAALELISAMLKWNPFKRPTAQQLMQYSFFTEVQESPMPMIKKSHVIRNNPFKIVKNIQIEPKPREQCKQFLIRRCNV